MNNEILRFPTDKVYKKSPEEKDSTRPDTDSGAPEIIRVDFNAERNKKRRDTYELFLRAVVLVPDITRFIRGLRGHISAESLAISEEIVRQYSDAEVVEILTNSTENDWRMKPAFFQTLVRRFEGIDFTKL